MKNILYTIILFFLFANVSLAVKLGYITGNKYQELSEADQTTWVVGVLDGIIAEDTFKRKSGDASIPWLSNCYDSGYELIQIKAIFEKYLKENPESWTAPAAFILRQQIYSSCNP